MVAKRGIAFSMISSSWPCSGSISPSIPLVWLTSMPTVMRAR